ncbi:MAG TPA: L-glutamate gamma-semialdehyde dehydrogenase [Candidatus Thermoplasmatota archaeon]|nr:L-glutamate gamma-semialdehyde dehydrogenase [Candidatus Thermoplasmatota archaeon]
MLERAEKPRNEKIFSYAPGTTERERLLLEIEKIKNEGAQEIPLIIGGKSITTDDVEEIRCPHNKQLVLGRVHFAGAEELCDAITAALETKLRWASFEPRERLEIFRKAADILADEERLRHVAMTMMTLSKNPYESEYDVAEFVDFLRFNSYYAQLLYSQTLEQGEQEMNRLDWRPLEGFVLAISPFNFYSLGGNLATMSALLGNVVIWKPATSVAVLNYEVMKLLVKAGLPQGVINFVPFRRKDVHVLLKHPEFAGLHFTGSYDTLVNLWSEIGGSLKQYKNIPRIVGETGGKGFVFVHSSADICSVAMNLIRGGFESGGQKCSAASRAYIPKSLWGPLKALLQQELKNLSYGPVEDLNTFMGAVIDQEAFNKIVAYIDYANSYPDYEIVCGGNHDATKGWFIAPTVIITKNPEGKLMNEEIFGPVVTIYVYNDELFEETLRLCNATSPYGLTGSFFGSDRDAIREATRILRYSAGNFYVNDKPTGSLVGHQPFGGSRHSGTNDKTGFWLSLIRWLSPRAIKENTILSETWERPFMEERPRKRTR